MAGSSSSYVFRAWEHQEPKGAWPPLCLGSARPGSEPLPRQGLPRLRGGQHGQYWLPRAPWVREAVRITTHKHVSLSPLIPHRGRSTPSGPTSYFLFQTELGLSVERSRHPCLLLVLTHLCSPDNLLFLRSCLILAVGAPADPREPGFLHPNSSELLAPPP